MNNFFSWNAFVPLGRLCYAAYLINLNLIKAYMAHQRKPNYVIESQFFVTFLGLIAVIFIVSFVLSITVELPFINLDKLLFCSNSSKTINRRIVNKVIKYSFVHDSWNNVWM